jgi:hypothetical protein
MRNDMALNRRNLLAASGALTAAFGSQMVSAADTAASRTRTTGPKPADPVAELVAIDQIRKLVTRYFHLIDNDRTADMKRELFTPTGRLLMGTADTFKGEVDPVTSLGLPRTGITGYTHCLHQYDVILDGDRAFGEVYCTANVMVETDGKRRMLVRAIRYLDHYVRHAGEWRMETRHHHVHWMYEEPLTIAVPNKERDHFSDFLASFGLQRP